MFQLDLKSRKSIYEQIVDSFKELIVAGVLSPNDKLPSVRDLSSTLTVNPNTIQKAYRELEQKGWIYTVSGLGCFVSEQNHQPDETEVKELYIKIRSLIKELIFLGVSQTDISRELEKLIMERRGSN